MAYDFSTLSKYDLNLEELRNYILQNRFNFEYFDEWVDGWMNVFKNAKMDTLTQIQNLEKMEIPPAHQTKKSKYPKTKKLTSPGENVQFFCFGGVIKSLS